MRSLLFSVSIFMISCDYEKPAPASSRDTMTAAIQVKLPASSTMNTTYPRYNAAIYKEIIPARVFELLNSELPNWELPAPERYEDLWFHVYKKDDALVNYLTGDVNCDGIVDYTLQLEKDNKTAIWVLLSNKNNHDAIKLYENERAEIIPFGLEMIPKGKLYYLTFDDNPEQPPPINLKCEAIQITYFETSAQAYYWDKDKFISVPTGD